MHLLAALVFGLFGCACLWYISRAWRRFRRDGHLRVRGRGLTIDFRHAWAVVLLLCWCGLLGAVALAVGVGMLVSALG